MSKAARHFVAGVAGCVWLHAGCASAGRPTMEECFEGSDFIGNAALSRDAGMRAEDFIGRMEQDFVTIRYFPSELRWFVHDPDDEVFLLTEARGVFDRPETPEEHRRVFLQSCVDRMAASESADGVARAPPRAPNSTR